jgi:hypothetical protein
VSPFELLVLAELATELSGVQRSNSKQDDRHDFFDLVLLSSTSPVPHTFPAAHSIAFLVYPITRKIAISSESIVLKCPRRRPLFLSAALRLGHLMAAFTMFALHFLPSVDEKARELSYVGFSFPIWKVHPRRETRFLHKPPPAPLSPLSPLYPSATVLFIEHHV